MIDATYYQRKIVERDKAIEGLQATVTRLERIIQSYRWSIANQNIRMTRVTAKNEEFAKRSAEIVAELLEKACEENEHGATKGCCD